MPRLVGLAHTLLESGEFDRLVRGSMQEAMSALWDRIEECALNGG